MENVEGGIKRKSRLAVFEHVVDKKNKPEHTNTDRLEDVGDSSPSESELVIDDEREPVKKRKTAFVNLTKEPLDLLCEWDYCYESFDSWENFNTHLIEHVAISSENLICQWNSCGLASMNDFLLIQHVSYHGYLMKLKNIGQNVLNRNNNLPQCTEKEEYTIPVSPNGYTCQWEYCTFNCCTIYDFYKHMEIHIKKNPRLSSEDNPIICFWAGCNNTRYSTQYKLAEHLRKHTKEKTIACPTCCTLLSNKTKFYDHRKRQLSTDLQSYQCSQCLKLFPSERLLRDHMRSHINHYKCTMCDMTCPKPSILAKHIRFKHVRHKPYKCTECSKSFVAKHNLDTHLKTHSERKIMKCDQCDFTCRSKRGLDNHITREHEKHGSVYECHCCRNKFRRGGYLTRHLMRVHNYHWPSGHSRFRYRKDQDGIYRLQTVRYESLEVTQEMIKSESMQTSKAVKEVSYNLRYDNDGEANYVLSVLENEEQSVSPTEPNKNNILITIEDVDEQGNVLKSQVVQSVLKGDIEITENGLPDLSKKIEATEPALISVGKVEKKRKKGQRSKRNSKKVKNKTVESEKEGDKTEDKHYFSRDVIFNYSEFRIDTTKSGS